jgi:hypothetical protein
MKKEREGARRRRKEGGGRSRKEEEGGRRRKEQEGGGRRKGEKGGGSRRRRLLTLLDEDIDHLEISVEAGLMEGRLLFAVHQIH